MGGTGLFVVWSQGFPERFHVDVEAIRPEPRINSSCRERFSDRLGFNYCKSTSDARPDVLFLGDSRAQAIYDGVVSADESNRALMLLARGGCPPLLNVELHYLEQAGCGEVWSRFAEFVSESKPSVVVLIGGGNDLMDPSLSKLGSSERWRGSRQAAFKAGLRELITTLQRTSRVIYVTEVPSFATPPSCFLRPIQLPSTRCMPTVHRSEVEANAADSDRIVRELQADLPELQVVHSRSSLCGRKSCSQRFASGELVYRDEKHLSTGGGEHFVRKSGLLSLLINDGSGSTRRWARS